MLALTLSAVVVAGCGAFAGCNNNSDGGNKVPETQKIEDLFDDRYVNLYGRNYYNEKTFNVDHADIHISTKSENKKGSKKKIIAALVIITIMIMFIFISKYVLH